LRTIETWRRQLQTDSVRRASRPESA
jgi:hypothetical protein